MNYEQLKAEAIRKAWIAEIGEEEYEKNKSSIIEETGGLIIGLHRPESRNENLEIIENAPFGSFIFRPKSLQGIEDNNGWVRINEDGSNLLSEGRYLLCHKDGSEEIYTGRLYGLSENYTHYKTIEKSKPPHF